MINGGEGTPRGRDADASFGRVASPDLSDAASSKSDGDEASPPSRYSSCGESEFERYCSANSAMGTPSLCSSVHYTDCLDSEFGSFRSSGFGDDSSLDNFSLGGRFDRSSERSLKVRFSQGSTNSDQVSSNNGTEISLAHGESDKAESGIPREGTLSGAGNASFSELSGGGVQFSQLNSQDHLQMVGKEDEEGGGGQLLLRYGHSEDEGSMDNYGSDDDSGKNLPYLRNIQHDQGVKVEGNPFLMNSSVAFGADDWDDFVQETGEVMADHLVLNALHEPREANPETQRCIASLPSEGWTDFSNAGKIWEGKDLKDLPLGGVQVLDPVEGSRSRQVRSTGGNGSRESAETSGKESQDVGIWRREEDKSSTWNSNDQYRDAARDSSHNIDRVRFADESEEYLNSCSITNIFETDQESTVEKAHLDVQEGPRVEEISSEVDHCMNPEKLFSVDRSQHPEETHFEDIDTKMDPLSDTNSNQPSHHPIIPMKIRTDFSDDEMQKSSKLMATETEQTKHSTDFHLPVNIYEEHTSPTKVENVELSEFLDDVLHDMEEILLDSTESPGARFSHGKRTSRSESTFSPRDGGLTASTSNANDVDTFIQHKRRIDGIEVIGAKQKKGDVSLSERLVGVKEYTVYVIKVWSGNDRWEVERRYRDFLTLYHRLKSYFTEQGRSLPSEWSSVDRESRKIFGSASPDVISERSSLIQDCLWSVIHSRFFSHPPNALLWFLSPQDSDSALSSPNNRLADQSTTVSEGTDTENMSNLGKTIPLIVEIRPYKSLKQLLEGQHYCCAGCRKHFDEGRTLVREFVQTLGWGKPRLCEYMGQLFCSSCHTNDTAVLPARVLHYWDFTEYPVCQLAKSYLDSIHDKPVLCVSAVNPFLFAKVPGLLHVMGIRRKIGSMLPCIRCPFHRSINRGLGSRRYLLESNDFFALRDLIDLSKGAFAALPTILGTVSKKILEHITEQCLICCDVGIPCSARQACRDPSSLIFPFQEDEVERCTFCKQAFHKQCFKKLGKCPCQVQLGAANEARDSFKMDSSSGALAFSGGRSGSFFSGGLLSTLFPKVNSERTKDHREDDTIILMGSLPSTSF
ncbi:uncharacterized protein LOC116212930 [Punica granatum]|uniref:Uncharacterized protein LOC116212930 n=1 Tax=Punica granatum TaxID=22663 RepID=A0A6P8E110_PUNGR|nr:uncharacterized protein LOC116212930 [Punica granatum]